MLHPVWRKFSLNQFTVPPKQCVHHLPTLPHVCEILQSRTKQEENKIFSESLSIRAVEDFSQLTPHTAYRALACLAFETYNGFHDCERRQLSRKFIISEQPTRKVCIFTSVPVAVAGSVLQPTFPCLLSTPWWPETEPLTSESGHWVWTTWSSFGHAWPSSGWAGTDTGNESAGQRRHTRKGWDSCWRRPSR